RLHVPPPGAGAARSPRVVPVCGCGRRLGVRRRRAGLLGLSTASRAPARGLLVSVLRRRYVELACLALGLALLLTIVGQVGLAGLVRDLRLIGWGLIVILLVEGLNVLFNTWGWGLAFPAGERTVSSRRLLAARLAGDGVNYLTPSATVGGELLRVRLLGGAVPLGLRWASVSVAKL